MAIGVYIRSCSKNVAGNSAVLLTEAGNIDTVAVSGGEVTAITMAGGETFKQVQANIDGIIRTEEGAGLRNNISYNHQVEMFFSRPSTELNALRDSLTAASSCGIVAIVVDSNGKCWLSGYNATDGTDKALYVQQDNINSGQSSNEEDVQEADIILESESGYQDLPLDAALSTSLKDAISAGGGTAIEWSPGGFVSAYQDVYDAMTIPPSAAIASAQNALVSTLVSAGIWSKFDIFHLFAQHTNAGGEALINWVNPGTHDCTLPVAPTFTALEGFTGNGTSMYINTNYNPTDDAVNFAQNDNAFGLYCRTDADEPDFDFGSLTGASFLLATRYATDTLQYGNGVTQNVPNVDARGMFVSSRTAALVTDGYRNGTSLETDVQASSGLATVDFYALSRNSADSPSTFSTKQLSMLFAGGSLSGSEVTTLTNAIETYMDSNSKGVIS